jgi:GST-like protein
MPNSTKLYGARTGNCFRVSIALEEAGIAYEVHVVDLGEGEQRSPEYIRLNPAGKVPTLIDHANPEAPFVLSQSCAIMLWAMARAPGRLAPIEEGPLRDRVLERFFYFVTDVIARSHAAFALRRAGASIDAANTLDRLAVEALTAGARFVSNAPFMAGDHFSIADIAAFTIASAYQADLAWAGLPELGRWYKSVAERPAVKRGLGAFDLSNSR